MPSPLPLKHSVAPPIAATLASIGALSLLPVMVLVLALSGNVPKEDTARLETFIIAWAVAFIVAPICTWILWAFSRPLGFYASIVTTAAGALPLIAIWAGRHLI
jgi:hypothetical protein